MAILGAVILVGGIGAGFGGGAATAGGVFLMIGVIWAIVGLGVGGYYAGVSAKASQEAQLFATGAKATGVIEGVQGSATTINDNPVIRISVRVTPRSGAEFVHERKLCVPPSGVPLPGHLVEVAYDPNDTSKVALQFDDRFSSPPARYLVTRPPGAAAAPAATGNALSGGMVLGGGAPVSAAAPASVDPTLQLERLAKLKEQGVLSDSEFQAQKARILSDL